jgi:hypothetical protein
MTKIAVGFTEKIKRVFTKPHWIHKPIKIILFYAFWILGIRLVSLSLITYFMISPTSHFQDISDTFSSYEIVIMGLSAFLFVFFLFSLNQVKTISYDQLITREQIEKRFFPSFIQGAFFAGAMALAFILSGVYRYLGYFIQLDDATLELLNLIIQMAALIALAYSEEFIFHYYLKKSLSENIPPLILGNVIAIFYCGIKMVQFDLGILHLITLYLVSLCLFYRTQNEEEFAKGAGFWAGILITFHPLLSLPVFGNSISGILLIKYQPPNHTPALDLDSAHALKRLITGGLGGPFSSFTFQLLLLLDISRSILKKNQKLIIHKEET